MPKKSKKAEEEQDMVEDVVIEEEIGDVPMDEDDSTYVMGKILSDDDDEDEDKVDLSKIPTDSLVGDEDEYDANGLEQGTIMDEEDPYLDAENYDGDNPDEDYYN